MNRSATKASALESAGVVVLGCRLAARTEQLGNNILLMDAALASRATLDDGHLAGTNRVTVNRCSCLSDCLSLPSLDGLHLVLRGHGVGVEEVSHLLGEGVDCLGRSGLVLTEVR